MRRVATAALLLLGVALPARAGTYLPLEVGNQWDYVGARGGTERTTISGTFERAGRTVYQVRYGEGGSNSGLSNFWTTEADGDVLLWGFNRELEGFGWYYDPPLRLVDAPLAVGKRWSQTSRLIAVDSGEVIGELTIGFEVYEAGPLELPAGSFDAFGVGQFLPPAWSVMTGGLHGLSGRASAGPAASQAVDWWSEDVGDVQFRADDLYQLRSFSFPTPVLVTSWGAVKTAYR